MHTYIYTYIYISICIYRYMHKYMNIYINMNIYLNIYICYFEDFVCLCRGVTQGVKGIHAYVCVCTCIYEHIQTTICEYLNTNKNIFTCILFLHIYTHYLEVFFCQRHGVAQEFEYIHVYVYICAYTYAYIII